MQFWVTSRHALELGADARGVIAYRAPTKIRARTKPQAYTQFWGLVQANDAVHKVIRLHIQPFAGRMQIPTGQSAVSELHYSTFQRVRLISPYHYEPRAVDPSRPTDHSPLSNTEYKPYRTAVEVRLR